MQSDIYYKDGVTRILELMKDTFGDKFTYFDAEPANVPEMYLPCIIVEEGQGTVDYGATGTDVLTETIRITLVLSKLDDIGASPDSELTGFKLRKLVKGQDPTTSYPYEYLEQSVMFALRTHITLTQAVIGSSITTEFNPNVRLGASDDDLIATEEAIVTISLTRQALIPVRD